MAINTNTLQENIDEVEAKIVRYLGGGSTQLLRNSFLKLLARTFGLLLFGIKKNNKKHLEDNLFIEKASDDVVLALGNRYGLTIKDSIGARGNVNITFEAATTLPINTKLSRELDGAIFLTEVAVTGVANMTTSVPVVSEEVGSFTNTTAGATMVLETINDDVGTILVGADGLVGGLDPETIEAFKIRLKEREIGSNTTISGTELYYKTLAEDVQGVTLATIFGGMMGSMRFCNGVTIVCEGPNHGIVPQPVRTGVRNKVTADRGALAVSINNIFVESIVRVTVQMTMEINTDDSIANRLILDNLMRSYFANQVRLRQDIDVDALATNLRSNSSINFTIIELSFQDDRGTEIVLLETTFPPVAGYIIRATYNRRYVYGRLFFIPNTLT